jgi:hypothetical protein
VFDDLRERLLTRAGAEALTHPAAILAAGVAAAGLVVVGAPVVAVVGGAVAGWGAVAASRLPPSRRHATPSLTGLQEPWRRYLVEAVAAGQRFEGAVDEVAPGPLRERLETIGDRVRDGVAEVDRIARHGSRLDRAIRELDEPDDIRRRLAAASGDPRTAPGVAEALTSQLSSTERIVRLAVDTRQRLQVLDAQLDEAVARVVELSLRQGEPAEAGVLGADVDGLVSEMEALRVALDETGGGSAGPRGRRRAQPG